MKTLEKPFTEQESLGSLSIYVKEWFCKNFDELTPPQKFAFKPISEISNVLITVPTGSGKTLPGFLLVISKLFNYALAGKLENKVYCIYLSPLRALNDTYTRICSDR